VFLKKKIAFSTFVSIPKKNKPPLLVPAYPAGGCAAPL
jgi:hypothetical protein